VVGARRAVAIVALAALCAAALLPRAAPDSRAPPGRRYRARGLRAVGVPPQEAGFDAGTWTITLGRGRWTMQQAHGVLGNARAQGDLMVAGSRALFTLTRIDGVPHHEFAGTVVWRLAGPSLRFTRSGVANIYELYVLVAQPWTRAG